jgi:hypothetical protein
MSTHSKGSGIESLDFHITRNIQSGELKFDPPTGSRALKDALHGCFHGLKDTKSRMQEAISRFCADERHILDYLRYQITRNVEDDELEFDPEKGTTRLHDALHFHFPEEKDYDS